MLTYLFVVDFRIRAAVACVLSCSALAIIGYGGMSSWGSNQSTQLSQISRGRKGSLQAVPRRAVSSLSGEAGEETTCDCSQVAHCYMCFKPSEGENEHSDKPREVQSPYTPYPACKNAIKNRKSVEFACADLVNAQVSSFTLCVWNLLVNKLVICLSTRLGALSE